MKKIITLVSVLLCLLALAGCGGNDAPVESAEPAPTPTDDLSEPQGPVQLGADAAIEGVTAIGFVDVDGAKLQAIAVKYSVDLTGVEVSAGDYQIEVSSPRAPTNNGGGEPGDILAVYVNDEPAVSPDGGSSSGSYVIIEVYTDYLSGSEEAFTT